ncbi:MAG: hypothetical protein U0Z44_10775 [Kouleothrix sp.]
MVTVLGPALVDLITGAVITESIFSIRRRQVLRRCDLPARLLDDHGLTLIYATLVVLANIVVDLSYGGLLDPRIRSQVSLWCHVLIRPRLVR